MTEVNKQDKAIRNIFMDCEDVVCGPLEYKRLMPVRCFVCGPYKGGDDKPVDDSAIKDLASKIEALTKQVESLSKGQADLKKQVDALKK